MLAHFHDDPLAGHPGIAETLRVISQNYYWPTRRGDTEDYVRQCTVCQLFKHGPRLPKAPLHHRVPTTAFEVISIDLMGPYPRSKNGNRYVITVMDLFTKWLEAYPIPKVTTTIITRRLENEFFMRYGYARMVISDNGP